MNTDHVAQAKPAPTTPAAVTELRVTGMTCQNCARHVAEALQQVRGVRHAHVNLEAGRATVHWTAGGADDVTALLAAVQRAGYDAQPVAAAVSDHAEHRQAGWQFNLWLGALVTAALMLGEWVFRAGAEPWFRWLAFALGGAVQIFAGAPFYRGAWRQLKIGSSNMDTLVALGSTTAFGYSAWALVGGAGGHLYFLEAAAIITLISIGHWLEARVSARASSALKSLLHLAPQTARKLETPAADAAETEVPVRDLNIGDLVALRPGDRVPTDGVVVEGASAVDEAMLTGEATPVDKSPNAQVYAGTVNLNGRLVMRVTATGEATALAHIIAAVQRAQNSRANIQRLADRVSNVFVPAVVLVALAAALWWTLAPAAAHAAHDWLARFLWSAHPPAGLAAGFIIAAAVLIIACPCAMGLATPAAIMAGANAAAQRGILIRDGVALEKAGNVTAVIFDKTGTLTSGKPVVAQTWAAEASGEKLALAGWLARHSSHPISQAVAAAGPDATAGGQDDGRAFPSLAPAEDWEEIRGAGVQGKLKSANGRTQVARFGSLRWLRESGVDLSAGEAFVTEWSGQGATLVGLALDQALVGLFAVRDALKPAAAQVVGQLQTRGLKIFLLTGDNALTARSIARQAGVAPENVFAEVRPEQKADFVRRLQQQRERVAFVGDGLNDAPALEQADLGIAVGRASDIAREAADIILLKSDLAAVPEALGLAQATLRTIRQNLFWAFCYNAAGVPLAALGFMSPVLCAAAMGLSDLVVIGNALRLRRWRLDSRL
jgi:Cu+-exporting ATPase